MHFIKTAVMVDGAFFHKRYRKIFTDAAQTPAEIARALWSGITGGIRDLNKKHANARLHRIFFYDSPPLNKRAENPVSKRVVDFSRTDEARFRLQFYEELKRMRKIALRLGRVSEGRWQISPKKTEKILKGKIQIADITAADVYYDSRQKGVDMRMGLDIATLSYQKLVDQIILISGDSDFVPAAKLARREGMDFVLDPMENPISADLLEHVDGVVSCWQTPAEQ